MLYINCKINLELSWFGNCVISSATEAITFDTFGTKLCFLVVTLLTQ